MGNFCETGAETCEDNRIPGAVKFSRVWLIPKDAEKPVDGRRIDSKIIDK